MHDYHYNSELIVQSQPLMHNVYCSICLQVHMVTAFVVFIGEMIICEGVKCPLFQKEEACLKSTWFQELCTYGKIQ